MEKLILDLYSPEEYASFWGCDPCYCHEPQLPNDGYMFYNFGSEQQDRTKEWLTEFIEAIKRLIMLTAEKGLTHDPEHLKEHRENMKGLQELKEYVEKLLEERAHHE